MRKKIVAGNWKMNKTRDEAFELISAIANGFNRKAISGNTHVILAPPFPYLEMAVNITKDSGFISVAAQNCYAEQKGPFTGEVSASMIASLGAKYVIIGHSERRAYFNETDDFLSKKISAALECNLVPVYCCGESLPERKNENQHRVVQKQLENGLFMLDPDEIKKTVIAYEPVWAIGTGVTATPDQAQKMHEFIRQLLIKKYGEHIAAEYVILYGGSCNAANARELFANTDVDGGLIGGASLNAEDFISIVHSF
ncbi:MAG: triose-phosphate isomerase [Bacteroidota bacterium]